MRPRCYDVLADVWKSLGGDAGITSRVDFTSTDFELESAFAVSDLAAGSVGAAGLAISEFIAARDAGNPAPSVTVDKRLASLWFGSSIQPLGWSIPPPWDSVAGDYQTSDDWIRLHTNAPHHRAAALSVLRLGQDADRAAVAAAVAEWSASELESAVVAAGGCAAAMRDRTAWEAHPQGRAAAADAIVVWSTACAAGPASTSAPSTSATAAQASLTSSVAWATGSTVPSRPLAGVRVLDLTRVIAGPVATRTLAGWGADVLRIDPPSWVEPSVIPETTLGKRCARLDLRSPGSWYSEMRATAHSGSSKCCFAHLFSILRSLCWPAVQVVSTLSEASYLPQMCSCTGIGPVPLLRWDSGAKSCSECVPDSSKWHSVHMGAGRAAQRLQPKLPGVPGVALTALCR
jgi:hypothetical protein